MITIPERSSISQVVQIGVEGTPGTAVAAGKRLSSLGIEPSPSIATTQFRPMGTKFQTLSIPGKELVEASITGQCTYDEIIYALSSCITAGVVTTPTGGILSRLWTFTPSALTEDNPKTFTVEQGSSVRAHRFVYGILTELGLSFSRDSIDISGSMFGRAIEDGITLTPNPTTVPMVPVVPATVCAYLNDTFATIGTTKLTRLLGLEWGLGDRWGQLWTIDCQQPSFVTHIEQEPSLTAGLTLEADATGMGLLPTVRAGATKFLRIEATGPIIEGTLPYKLTIDMPVKIVDTGGFSDEDGVYAVEWSMVGVYDGTFNTTGGALQVRVQNTQLTL